jgi:unsaturated rhamnogalacturonyl hydrolase
MLKYQDEETGMWYQLVDKAGCDKNYLETSGSCIFAYAIMKSVHMGILDRDYYKYGEKAFLGTCKKYLSEVDGHLQLDGICLVAGLGPEKNRRRDGSYEYYMSEPIVSNDAKGVAPLVLAYIETLYEEENNK